MVRKTVKKKVKRKPKVPAAKIINVGVMGRDVKSIALTTNTTADEVAKQIGVSYRSVQASKNGRTNFKDIKATALVNGFGALLFVPKIDGGAM